MTTTGEKIFWENARSVLRNIDMQHLDPAHGAAVDIVRRCLLVRGRPTHHRQTFLEQECPALLIYLEKLTSSGDAAGWRALRDRVQLHAELLRETDMQPCARPWLAAIWHALPELATIGQRILDGLEELKSVADFQVEPASIDTGNSGNGDEEGGGTGKTGSAGTPAKPKPLPRLALPVVPVAPTEAERKALGLNKRESDAEAKNDPTPDGVDGPEGPTPRGPQ